MWLLALSLLALADEPALAPTDVPADAPVALELASEQPALPSIEALIDEARGRIREADFEGAGLMLNSAAARAATPQEVVAVRYFQGIVLELEGRLPDALRVYEDTAQAYQGVRAQDLQFRRAEVLGSMGRYDDAIASVDALGEVDDEADRAKVALVRAIWQLQGGDVPGGRDAIAQALAHTAPADATYYQAKAHAIWAQSLVAESRERSLDVSPRKQVRALEARAVLMKATEEHIVAVANLGEVEWILDGLITLGQGYTDVGDALLTARPPRKIARRQDRLAAYNAALRGRAEVVWTKAHGYYVRGRDTALAHRWHGARVDAIEPAIADVEARFQ